MGFCPFTTEIYTCMFICVCIVGNKNYDYASYGSVKALVVSSLLVCVWNIWHHSFPKIH